MPSHLNQQSKGSHTFCVIHVLIARLRGSEKAVLFLFSFREIQHSQKLNQDFAEQQLAAYKGAWLGPLWHFNSAVI